MSTRFVPLILAAFAFAAFALRAIEVLAGPTDIRMP